MDMTKKRRTILVISVLIAVVAGVFYQSAAYQKYRAQVGLAKELHKAMNAMMNDFREAQTASVQGVSANGQWRHAIAFTTAQGPVRYQLSGPKSNELKRTAGDGPQLIAHHIGTFNIRRLPEDSAVLEVQIAAQNKSSLSSNFKVRMRD